MPFPSPTLLPSPGLFPGAEVPAAPDLVEPLRLDLIGHAAAVAVTDRSTALRVTARTAGVRVTTTATRLRVP